MQAGPPATFCGRHCQLVDGAYLIMSRPINILVIFPTSAVDAQCAILPLTMQEINVRSANSKQSKLRVDSPLRIDARLLWEQTNRLQWFLTR